MQNLTGQKLVNFKRLPQGRKQTYANNLKKPVDKTESGGDYWISSVSALANACKNNDVKIISTKIDFLLSQVKATANKRTKDMYQRNIDILTGYKEYDFRKLKPKKSTGFETRSNTKYILTLKGFSVQVFPSHVYTYRNEETDEVGGVWFVAKLGGFKNDELDIFSELLYKYLLANYSKKHTINPSFCSAIDVVNRKESRYSKIIDNNSQSVLDMTLTDLKKYLNK